MTSGQASPRLVVVTGDVTMDWHVARSRAEQSVDHVWNPDEWTRASWQRGGAALLADLVQAVTDQLEQSGHGQFALRQTNAPRDTICPDVSDYHHSYALWSKFSEGDESAWRVEEHLGLDLGGDPESQRAARWEYVVDDTPDADLIVLDDAGLGFRQKEDIWPQALKVEGRQPWVLLKMAEPLAKGPLWEHLRKKHAERLIVVTTVNDLRRTEVQISHGLSWERTAQDVAWELVHNPRVNGLARCAAVVVSFYTAGAVVLTLPDSGTAPPQRPRARLVFDPLVIEGMWRQQHPGGMIGYTTCLTAGMVRELLRTPQQPNIEAGTQSGLRAMRTLHRRGYGERRAARRTRLAFPVQLIAEELASPAAPFAVVDVQDPVQFLEQPATGEEQPPEAGWWTILQDRYRDNLDAVARRIVRYGPESVLRDVPQGRFGHLLTVDRREIESFRSIHALVSEYLSYARQKRPLSIAVFGAPGSGKSFGITEVAKSLGREQIEVLEFNLSQFEEPGDVTAALHRVRDVALAGKTPLVFWDEFDTSLAGKPLGWLRYFLSPMQDGSFQEGQIVHPIGRAIFVFAGGTSHRMERFGQHLHPEERRAAKVPDFISRLKGYVNIMGPNRQPTEHDDGAVDPYYVIRRAILLRSLLQRDARQLFRSKEGRRELELDRGVLRAFLEVSQYKHGVRSMESIIAMSQLAGKASFERSSLPPEVQLNLHVNGREFLALVRQIDLQGELLEKLAAAHHSIYCDELRGKGYRYGEARDDQAKTNPLLKPYAELSEEEKEQNRAAVRDIPTKLARIGYTMIPARSNEPPFQFPGPHLEELARLEHNRWIEAKVAQGWRYGPERDDAQKLHPALLPWRQMTEEEKARLFSPSEVAAMGTDELPDEEKEKDRALIRGIPKILARAGYTVVKLREEAKEE